MILPTVLNMMALPPLHACDYQNNSSSSISYFDQTRKQLKDAHKQFNELDRRYGSKVRQQMWKNDEHTQTSVNTADEKENEMITEIKQAITKLDESVIDMLFTEYLISYPTYDSSISPG